MKHTAVDYLFEKLWATHKDKFTWQMILKEAKEMEKDQIKQAYLDSSEETCCAYGEEAPHDDPKFAELYYKQTYEDK
jgi:predicted P-loop ATPase